MLHMAKVVVSPDIRTKPQMQCEHQVEVVVRKVTASL